MNNIVDKINIICQEIRNIKINKVKKNKDKTHPNIYEEDEEHDTDSLYNKQTQNQSNSPHNPEHHDTSPTHSDLPLMIELSSSPGISLILTLVESHNGPHSTTTPLLGRPTSLIRPDLPLLPGY